MAKSKIDELENLVELSQPAMSTTFQVYEAPPVPVGMPGLIRLENRTSVEIDVTLTDGTNVRMWPKIKGKAQNISEPFLRKLLPSYINKLVSKGDIKIINC
jgi:hypothetical protein